MHFWYFWEKRVKDLQPPEKSGLQYKCLVLIFVLFFFCCFTSHVNSYGHCRTVSSLNHTFSWAGLNKRLTSNCAHTFACNWQQPFLNKSAEGRRMTVEIISWSISTKVVYQARIELATPWSAVRHASVARHVTNCATRPGIDFENSVYVYSFKWN